MTYNIKDVKIGSGICVNCFGIMHGMVRRYGRLYDFESVYCVLCGRFERRKLSHRTGKITTEIWLEGDQKSPF